MPLHDGLPYPHLKLQVLLHPFTKAQAQVGMNPLFGGYFSSIRTQDRAMQRAFMREDLEARDQGVPSHV